MIKIPERHVIENDGILYFTPKNIEIENLDDCQALIGKIDEALDKIIRHYIDVVYKFREQIKTLENTASESEAKRYEG